MRRLLLALAILAALGAPGTARIASAQTISGGGGSGGGSGNATSLQGNAIAATPPSSGNCLVFSTTWGPGSCAVGGGGPTSYTVNLTGQTASVALATLFTPASAGFYVACANLHISTTATTSSATPSVIVVYTEDGTGFLTAYLATSTASNSTGTSVGNCTGIYVDAGTAVKTETSGYASSGATAMAYSLHIRITGPY
ncbi:MAG: hypothetical protein ACRD1C_03860 [Terriglobales bacterium]